MTQNAVHSAVLDRITEVWGVREPDFNGHVVNHAVCGARASARSLQSAGETDPLGLFSWGAAALAVGGIIAGAALIAVCLPAIAVTVAGMAAVAGVVAGKEGAKIGFDVALLVLTAGAAGPGLALAEGGVVGR